MEENEPGEPLDKTKTGRSRRGVLGLVVFLAMGTLMMGRGDFSGRATGGGEMGCGGSDFKQMEEAYGATFSNDGTRAAGVMKRWEGACDDSQAFWIPGIADGCLGYASAGFTKNHRFRIWVTDGEINRLAGAHQSFENSDGHFTQELEGEVLEIEYVSSSIHHYLLVTAKTVNFTQEGDSNNHGDIILYYIPLNNNGQVAGDVEVLVRKPAGTTCQAWGLFKVYSSPDGRFFSVLENKGNCDGLTNQLQLFRADTRAIMSTQALEDPFSFDPFYTSNRLEGTDGAWVQIPAGTNSEITEATLSVDRNPLNHWNEDQNGKPCLANPVYRRAYVNYIDLLKSYSEAPDLVSVFLTRRSWDARAFWKLYLIDSEGSGVETIEPTVLQDDSALPVYQSGLRGNRKFIDLEHSMIRQQIVEYWHRDPFQFHFPAELHNSSITFAEDPTASFHWMHDGWASGINGEADHNAQVGDLFSAAYKLLTVLPGAQSMIGTLTCFDLITGLEGDHPQVDYRCHEGEWTGAAKELSWGRVDWTYDNEDRLYICEVRDSTRFSVENAAIAPANLESGCKGQAWKLMAAADF